MKKILVTILFSLIVFQTYGQGSDSKLIKTLIDKGVLTKEEAKEILDEAKVDTPKGSKHDLEGVKDLVNNKYLQLGGYAQLLYNYNNTAAVKNDGSVRSAFFSLKGEPVNKLNYFLLFNFRDPSLTEYYVNWNIAKELNFKVGQQKVPISIENQLSLSALEFIQNARAVNYLVGGAKDVINQNSRNSGGRDLGVQALGRLFKYQDRSLLEYNVGIFQGSGINKSAPRSDKDFIANALISPIEGFRIGGGVQFGEAAYGSTSTQAASIHVRNRWIVSSDYKCENFYARAEWINGSDGGVDKEGIYGMFTYSFVPNKWLALARVDYYNNNKDRNLEVYDYTAGINYILNKYCRLQANYTYSDYSKKWTAKNSHVVEAQFQIVF